MVMALHEPWRRDQGDIDGDDKKGGGQRVRYGDGQQLAYIKVDVGVSV